MTDNPAELVSTYTPALRIALTALRHALNEGARLHLEAERYQGDFECDFTVARDWITVSLEKYREHHDSVLIPALHALAGQLVEDGFATEPTLLAAVQWYEAAYFVRTDFALWPSPFA